MTPAKDQRLPPGRQPYDPLSGLRVGAVAGGILGAAVIAVTSFAEVWLMLVGAVIGGAIGFWSEKRKV